MSITNIDEYVNSQRKPKAGIPSGSIVKALLMQCKFTKEGDRRQSIIGGIGLTFAFLSYFKDEAGTTTEIKCIDYSDIKNITFPIDILNSDGTTTRPGLMSQKVYLTENMLIAKNFNKVESEQGCIALYAYEFSRRFGPKAQIPLIHYLIGTGMAKTVTAKDFNIDNLETRFPIFTVRRYGEMKYDKRDLDPQTKQPLPNTEKKFSEELTTYNKDSKIADLNTVDVEYIDATTAIAINTAMIKRAEQKKSETPSLQSSTEVPPPF